VQTAARFGLYCPGPDDAAALSALDRLEAANTWARSLATLERAAAALNPEAHGLTPPTVNFTCVLADPGVIGERNDHYTGNGGTPGVVMLQVWPTPYNIERLEPIVAHELHHNVRFLFEPFTMHTTVGQYLVAEGLAEAFAAEQTDEALLGRWTLGLAPEALEPLRPVYRDALDVSGFSEIRGYIFGDWAAAEHGYRAIGLPDFAGYALGYRLVRAYLERSGRTAAEATYVPWREIVEESGYLR
jgi:uncharacterized protein YjaZ